MMHAPGKMALSAIVLLVAICFRPSVAQTNTTATTTITTATTSNTTSTMEMTTVNDTATTTEATTTTSTTTTPPTTTQPPYDLDHLKTAFYTLEFTVGITNASDIQYNVSMSMADLLMKFEAIFSSFSQGVELMRSNDDNRTYTLVVTFLYEMLDNSTILEDKIMKAVQDIKMSFSIPNTNTTDNIVAQFLNATMDICQAMDVCPIGFSCNSMGCESLCRMEDCSGHGMCYVILLSNNTAQTMCNCDDTYDTEYEGDRCQDDRRGRDQIIAILAGVLGTACFILLVICILLCVFYCRRNKEYNFTPRTHNNQAFDGTHTSKN